MTKEESKIFLDNILLMLEDIKQVYIQKKTEAMDKSLQYEEQRKVYSIKERTIDDLIYNIKCKQKEIETLFEEESE